MELQIREGMEQVLDNITVYARLPVVQWITANPSVYIVFSPCKSIATM